jgi:hypothetical protein
VAEINILCLAGPSSSGRSLDVVLSKLATMMSMREGEGEYTPHASRPPVELRKCRSKRTNPVEIAQMALNGLIMAS